MGAEERDTDAVEASSSAQGGSVAELTRARDRLALLLEMSELLTGSLADEQSFEAFGRFLVPRVADGCVIDVVEPDGSLARVVSLVNDPEKAELAEALKHVGRPDPSASIGILPILRDRRPVLLLPDLPVDAGARNAEHARILRALAPTSGIAVPLVARDAPLGVLWVYTTSAERRYDEEDVGFMAEIARRAALALDNARLYQRAETAVRIREEFLSIASHELRTPITTLHLVAQWLVQSTPSELGPMRQKAETIMRQTERLTRLIAQLLDVTRLSETRIELVLEPTDLAGVVREVATAVEPQAARMGVPIRLNVTSSPLVGRWDAARVEQIVQNLITNAIKFSERHPVDVDVTQADGEARVRVVDRGIGIDPADQARIFERFGRGVSSRRYGGLGLGLWIAREAAIAMGGRIEVVSAKGKGSTFTLSLPLAP